MSKYIILFKRNLAEWIREIIELQCMRYIVYYYLAQGEKIDGFSFSYLTNDYTINKRLNVKIFEFNSQTGRLFRLK